MKKHEVQNHKENTEMALIDELKKSVGWGLYQARQGGWARYAQPTVL